MFSSFPNPKKSLQNLMNSPKLAKFGSIVLRVILSPLIGITTVACLVSFSSLATVFLGPFLGGISVLNTLLWGFGGLAVLSGLVLGGAQLIYGKDTIPTSELMKTFAFLGFVAASSMAYFLPLELGYGIVSAFWASGIVSSAWWAGYEVIKIIRDPFQRPMLISNPIQQSANELSENHDSSQRELENGHDLALDNRNRAITTRFDQAQEGSPTIQEEAQASQEEVEPAINLSRQDRSHTNKQR